MSIIYTERLILRPFHSDDAEEMYKAWTYDERVARYCRWYPHENVGVTEKLLDMYLKEAESGFGFRWAIMLKESGKLIGAIDVVNISEDGKTAEVGYVLSHDYWDKGFMTEAFRSVIKKLSESGFEKVAAQHHVGNPASGRVMEKCGLNFTGFGKEQEKFGSEKTVDVKCYELKL